MSKSIGVSGHSAKATGVASVSSSAATTPSNTNQPLRRSARKRRSAQSLKYVPNGNGHASDSMTSMSAHRTPRSARFSDDEEEVKLGLLTTNGIPIVYQEPSSPVKSQFSGMSRRDKNAVALLVVLYLIQGVPIGLVFGSIPFLLKSRLSYTQLGLFSLSTFPYSLKLLHAPIVDAVFSHRIGRRKSWIVPIQILMGSLLIWIGANAANLIESDHPPIHYITFLFTGLIFLAATQDIAVDGWALTLLSHENLSFASTAQTAGLNSGYFLSFTVFLALNSAEFADKYFRTVPSEVPLVSLAQYMTFWGFASFAVSLWLLIFKKEDPVIGDDDDLHLKKVYKAMWSVCKLKHVQQLCAVHMIAKIGFQANEAVTNLKMIEKGLNKEDLALVVLVDFPFQILGGWLAGRWSVGNQALRPWLWGFWGRLGFAIFYMIVVWAFPKPPIPASFFLMLIVSNVLSGFTSTIQFVGVTAFHTQIADPVIGGTYMTLLNTISNLGGTWPRYFVLRGVDAFTVATCHIPMASLKETAMTAGAECVSDSGKALCTGNGGSCVIERDGYYYMSSICVAIGVLTLLVFIRPVALKLQALPLHKWRLPSSK